MTKKKISIIISILNEEDGITSFWEELKSRLSNLSDYIFEVLWVNDGSTDNTQKLLEQFVVKNNDQQIYHQIIEFSKNFGHEAAMLAGIDNSTGDAIICMDSDRQHPPKEIENILEEFENGNEIVLMERINREDGSFLKKIFSKIFYKIINSLSKIQFQENSTDFFLISREIANIFNTYYRDKNRFIRGFIQSVGFSTKVLPFNAPAREFGSSKYSLLTLLKLALNAIFSFSNKPLRITIFISIFFILFTFIFSVYSLYQYIETSTIPSGYTTIVLFLSFAFSLLFLSITILSLYFEKIIQEMQNRPIYIVKKIVK